jgi:hypothetical protein
VTVLVNTLICWLCSVHRSRERQVCILAMLPGLTLKIHLVDIILGVNFLARSIGTGLKVPEVIILSHSVCSA